MDTSTGATDRGGSGASAVESLVISIAVSGAAGLVAGAVWGGIGGRVAMRLVFLTSSDAVRGVTSDDGFEIGRFSADTIVLVIFAAIVGMIGGLGVGVIRVALRGPTGVVAAGVGAAAALGIGANIVHADGIDFVFLDPLWLTVGLFVVLPGLWGASVVVATDWLLAPGRIVAQPSARGEWFWPSVAAWLVLGAFALVGGLDLISDVQELRQIR